MFLRRTAVGAALIAAPLAFAAPAMAAPGPNSSVGCQTGCDIRGALAAATPDAQDVGAYSYIFAAQSELS